MHIRVKRQETLNTNRYVYVIIVKDKIYNQDLIGHYTKLVTSILNTPY